MQKKQAEIILKNKGYKNLVELSLPKGHINKLHSHHWDADIIITSGSIRVIVDEKEYKLKEGDSFQVKAGKDHIEYVGDEGVTIISARP